MSRLAWDGTAEPVSRDQIDKEIIIFPCSADHGQDWQPYPVDPYYGLCNVMATHTISNLLPVGINRWYSRTSNARRLIPSYCTVPTNTHYYYCINIACRDRCMDGWMHADGWMDGWMDGWCSLPRVRRHRASRPQGSSSYGRCLFRCHLEPTFVGLCSLFSHQPAAVFFEISA